MKQRHVLYLVTAVVILLGAVAPLRADWDIGQPAKWIQRPDLTTNGIDVNASEPYLLADDFECIETGPITSIHVWGSWLWDRLPFNTNPNAVTFTLSIHADIPANPPEVPYSQPGELLWLMTFDPGTFQARIWQEGIEEGWMDPPDDWIFPADWTCWQYNFFIDPTQAFVQQGDPDQPIVYWLDLQAAPQDTTVSFGWKTSTDHWNDDAVWGRGVEPFSGPWRELIYPPGHEQQGQSIDLAFVIVGEEEPNRDWGDARDGAAVPHYPTLAINFGANHVIGGPWLGDLTDNPDPDPDGQPSPTALGDDTFDGNDDEDGVTIPALEPGNTSIIIVEVNSTSGGGGVLEAWIDWDGDESWPASEMIFAGMLPDGIHNIPVTPPASAVIGQTFGRFRISSAGGLSPRGPAQDGEVEDHLVDIREPQAELDFGDAPDGLLTPIYPVYLSSNGARHPIVSGGPWLGDATDSPDPEADGQASGNALGDDLSDLNDDEDGVQIPPMTQGQVATINYEVNGGGGYVAGWIDFNGDQVWQSPGELIITGLHADGFHAVNVNVPAGAIVGQTFARFRISSAGALPPDGLAQDGEVEDYEVWIEEAPQTYKWEQKPDLTPEGIDVNANEPYPYLLADDFLCMQSGPITEIQIWGSWLNDQWPFMEDPGAVMFTLSIHKDIPADQSPTGYSMPGQLLWLYTFPSHAFSVEPYATNIVEGWLNPPDQYLFPADWTCWLYTFQIPESEAFWQEGTATDSMIYWLDLQATPDDPDAWFGWKTSEEHWNDDAVWIDAVEPFLGDWFELRYPPGHPFFPESIDLAFRIFTEVQPPELDYGDAPEPTFPTTFANNGASHVIVPGLFLGFGVDADPNGQPDPMAMGDDNDGNDDEDGVTFVPNFLRPGAPTQVDVIASVPGLLDAWIDFHGDGSWATAGDQVFLAQPLNPGLNSLSFTVPATGLPGQFVITRWRFTRYGGVPFDGPEINGEVEDHAVWIEDDMTGHGDGGTPERFELYQAVPNPFNPSAAIRFDVPTEQKVELTIYTVDGRRIRTLLNDVMRAGHHTVVWNGRNDAGQAIASGTYFYRIDAGTFSKTMSMTLIK